MDSFSLVQVIEKNPELKFKYMGSYPSDKVSQLTKYSVATINTAPINNSGEHWITKARIEKKNLYFADSSGRKKNWLLSNKRL